MNQAANTRTAFNNSSYSTSQKRRNPLPAVALAAVMTLAMLGGIDQLATGSSAAGHANPAAVQLAKAGAPRA